MFNGQGNDLFFLREESDAFMGGGTDLVRLQGETTQAFGITAPADRDRGFPSLEEKIFGGKTVVIDRAVDEMLGQGAGCDSFFISCYRWDEGLIIIELRIPTVVVFHPKS
jgi:hypothetical protein